VKRYLLPGILAAACVVQLSLNVYTVVSKEIPLAAQASWRFRVEPVDPLDPLSGRYVRFRVPGLELGAVTAPGLEGVDPGSEIYGILSRDAEGFGYVASVNAFAPPEEGAYVRLKYLGSGRVEAPFDRFYLNEKRADEVQRALGAGGWSRAYITVRFDRGRGAVAGFETGN
jgi:hypothetical protein